MLIYCCANKDKDSNWNSLSHHRNEFQRLFVDSKSPKKIVIWIENSYWLRSHDIFDQIVKNNENSTSKYLNIQIQTNNGVQISKKLTRLSVFHFKIFDLPRSKIWRKKKTSNNKRNINTSLKQKVSDLKIERWW